MMKNSDTNMVKRHLLWLLLLLSAVSIDAKTDKEPQFSTAGFYEIANSGRKVFSLNPAWRFYKGDVNGAQEKNFDDSSWSVVSLPHGIEYLPMEASGCVNYQGIVWYRKRIDAPKEYKKLTLYFEAIMGKSEIYVNGKLLETHYGGYLPIVIDVTDALKRDGKDVIAVKTDNSDNPSYPPGKPQDALDFTYFGGIYRDCWLVGHGDVYITDANADDKVAGGGVVVSFSKVSESSADVRMKTYVKNDRRKKAKIVVEYNVMHPIKGSVYSSNDILELKPDEETTVDNTFTLLYPDLWSPDRPFLYDVYVRIYTPQGDVIDGYRLRMGVRSIEFKGKDGFWLNGEPYNEPLIGANRHQDFAEIGNAVPNSMHWRDAKKLRDAGMKVIRNAHCPQDPAFMDACDELGLFVIVNTPGWQFWNKEPEFEQRVYSDIRNLVRRDRNHACVLMWEPILNETYYPDDFAKNTRDIVDAEYPFPYCYSGCDSGARGKEYFPIHFTHPMITIDGKTEADMNPNITYFTREWGDNVDDWNSHNSPSRVARNWGEEPMRIQARHYANPPYHYTCYNTLYQTSRQHVGGCLWHSFDHQRGYHPDPFYGGLMDAFRQPKYSYYMFKAQRPAKEAPMVFIAHEMTPFSGADVTVYSNCDSVRLTYNKGGKTWMYRKDKTLKGMPSPVITFKDVFDVMQDKAISRQKRQLDSYLLAEGFADGRIVAQHKVMPARRPVAIKLWLDNEGTSLHADGSDVVTVVAAIVDKNGTVKRLNNEFIRFEIEGEGRIIGDQSIMANPAPMRWGTAPVLIQSTTQAGIIKLKASVWYEGKQTPVSGTLEFESKPATHPMIYDSKEAEKISASTTVATRKADYDRKASAAKLKEVEDQQEDFGEK